MNGISISHRLDGLEPDNLLAFLALLGLLRSLEADDRARTNDQSLRPRIGWDIEKPPLRPRLFVAHEISVEELIERSSAGLENLAAAYDFSGRKDLNYSPEDCRVLLGEEVRAASATVRGRIDLLSSLMSDGALKNDKEPQIDPTPLCLLFGQGHQHFLDRLAGVPAEPAPPPRGKGKKAVSISAAQTLREALFEPWHRTDPTPSFRWDPEEDVRYALMPGDPTDPAYKIGTQHGANRLAALGLSVLTLVPRSRGGRVRATIIGGESGRDGFSFAWPIWREAATLAAIKALLAHPELRKPGALSHVVVETFVARRISVGKFMNFGRARPLRET